MLLDDFKAWAQVQMEGITEDNLRFNAFNITWQHAFDGAISTNWHKDGCLYYAMFKR